jgi:hypothetical protein
MKKLIICLVAAAALTGCQSKIDGPNTPPSPNCTADDNDGTSGPVIIRPGEQIEDC